MENVETGVESVAGESYRLEILKLAVILQKQEYDKSKCTF